MKYIKLLIIIMVFIILFFIYKNNKLKTYNYLSIGDNISLYDKYVYEYIQKNNLKTEYNKIEVTDINKLIKDINDNISINKKNIQNLLFNADIITISIEYNKINIDSLNNLLKLIRKYNLKKIYITNYYDFDNNTYEINKNLLKLCDKYTIKYIDLNNIFIHNKKLFYQNYPYPNTDVYKLITNDIIKNM